jgi:hypothetical protein
VQVCVERSAGLAQKSLQGRVDLFLEAAGGAGVADDPNAQARLAARRRRRLEVVLLVAAGQAALSVEDGIVVASRGLEAVDVCLVLICARRGGRIGIPRVALGRIFGWLLVQTRHVDRHIDVGASAERDGGLADLAIELVRRFADSHNRIGRAARPPHEDHRLRRGELQIGTTRETWRRVVSKASGRVESRDQSASQTASPSSSASKALDEHDGSPL